MRIQFVRTGGFAGMRLATDIDSDALPPEEVHELRDELDSADFFSLPPELAGNRGVPDSFQYEITVHDGGKKHTVQAGESALPENLQPLVQHLVELAKTRRGT